MSALLEVRGLSRSFGGVTALERLDLDLGADETLGLIGPNGSGKTTLFNLLTGLYRPDAGRVRLAGEDVTGLPPHAVVRRGVARTFQNLRSFGRMSVAENLRAALHAHAGGVFPSRTALREEREAVAALLETAGLADDAEALPADLPLARLRRLELVRALAPRPRLLLLDEPAAGMTPAETETLGDLLAETVLPGRAVILIEHKIDLVARLCPRLLALDSGRRIAEGETRAVLRDPAVREAWLGLPAVG